MAKTIDQLTKAVNAKLQTLKLTQGQAITVIEGKTVLSMERIQNALKKKVEEVHDLKTEIQELMFEAEKEEDEIVEHGKEIEERVSVFEKTIDQLDVTIKECKQVETHAEEKEKEKHDAQLREKRYDEEMRFEKAKLEQKLKYQKKTEEKKPSCQNLSSPSSKALPPTGCGFGANSQRKLTRQMFHRLQSFPTLRSFWSLKFDRP